MIKEAPEYIYKAPLWGHFAVRAGSAEGTVCIFIKKSFWLWLYRLIIFQELNPFVIDQEGSPCCFNKWEYAEQFLLRKARYKARYEYCYDNPYTKMRPHSWYEEHWKDSIEKYGKIVSPAPYNQQFHLELPMGIRVISDNRIE